MSESVELDFTGIDSKIPSEPIVSLPAGSALGSDGPVKVSLNQLLIWDRCRLQWTFRYTHKLESTKKKPKMELGSMGHEMLFDWYSTGLDHSADFVNKWMSDMANLDGDQIQNVSVAAAMFKLYIHEFSPSADRGLRTDSLEEHFEVELKTPLGRNYVLEGYIDRTSVDEKGHLWVEDYKWTGRFWSGNELLMDPQLSFYAGALRTLGRPVHGLMITQVNTYPYKDRSKKKPEELFKRERIYRSPEELDAVMVEIGKAVDEMIDEQDKIRRSLRKDCARDCDFFEPCLFGLKGIDPLTFIKDSGGFRQKKGRPTSAPEQPPTDPLRIRI